jgi:hypothetical protein
MDTQDEFDSLICDGNAVPGRMGQGGTPVRVIHEALLLCGVERAFNDGLCPHKLLLGGPGSPLRGNR